MLKKNLKAFLPLIERIEEDRYFDICGRVLTFVEYTTKNSAAVRSLFPEVKWEKKWDRDMKQWNYRGKLGDLEIAIIGNKENPLECTPRTEKRIVKEKVPVAFEEREVEKEVIVGWDCKEPEASAAGEGAQG